MVNIVYDFQSFKGINTMIPASAGGVLTCDNYDAMLDLDTGATAYSGFLTKYPLVSTQLGDTISTSISRGIYYFAPTDYAASNTLRYIQGFDDGTLRYLHPSTLVWTSIASSMSTACNWSFDSYSLTLFAANGYNPVKKWKTNWSSTTNIKDKGASATNLTGTLTFTLNSTALTGSSTAFDTELVSGDWIRTSSSATAWYEILSVTSATVATLNTEYLSATASFAAAQKAANATIRGRFVIAWKDRLWIASGDASSLPIVGEVVCDTDTTRPLP